MRRKLQLLVGAALAALGVPACADAPGGERPEQPTGAAFAPPQDPMVLTRELRRTVGHGGEVVSRRYYAIRFLPEGRGWKVEGKLVNTEVEAPAAVPAELVELERTRGDEGLFPLHLDAAGLIVRQQGTRDPQTSQQALAAARDTLAKANLSEAERAAAMAMVERIQAQVRAAGGNWPEDLFRPSAPQRSEVRAVPLGNGLEGRITVSIAAADGQQGIVDRFERKVLTETGGTSRLSVETWTLRRSR